MKIAIIGNGCHPRWHRDFKENNSAFIDSCDVVVRQNSCPHYYRGYTGWRSDILVLRSAHEGGTGLPISWMYDATVPERVARDVKKIIVVAENDDTLELCAGPHCERYGWSRDQIEMLPYSYREKVRDDCHSDSKYYMITLGTVTVHLVIDRWPDAEVYLSGYCFQYLGHHLVQSAHDVYAEYEWIKQLELSGRVTFVQ